MLQLLTGRKTSPIAVEFGACSLRAVQLHRRGGKWHAHHWFNIEKEPAEPQPPALDYASEMQLAFGPGTFSGRMTSMVLGPPDVEYRLLELPPAVLQKSSSELRQALQFELDRQMPWPLSDAEIAVWPVQPGATSTANAMVAASRSSAVKKCLDLFSGNGLECGRADLVPNALIRLSAGDERKDHTRGEKLWGVIDMGFRSCRLYLLYADQTVYARVLRGGGRELTETLARALRVDFRIAEQYKRIYGIQETDRGFRSLMGGASRIGEDALPSVLYAILRPTLDGLASEIEKSCRFALGRLAGASAGVLYLIGGGARMRGLKEALASRLGVPVLLPEPRGAAFAPFGENPLFNASQFPVLASCIGTAMAEEEH